MVNVLIDIVFGRPLKLLYGQREEGGSSREHAQTKDLSKDVEK